MCRILVLIVLPTSFPTVNPDPTIISCSIWKANQATSCRAYPGIGRSLDSLSVTFRLSHRVKDRIYWTKVSINTFVSDDRVDAEAF